MGTHPRCVQTPSKVQSQTPCIGGIHQKSLHTQHDQPFRFLYAVFIGLRVSKFVPINVFGFLDLICSTMTDKDWLASPFDDDLIAVHERFLGEIFQLHLHSCPPELQLSLFLPWPERGHRRRLTC